MVDQKNYITLGIDPGTRITGYGVVQSSGQRLEALDYGSIKLPVKLTLPEKHLIIFNGMESIIDKYQPDAISIESQFLMKNAQSALKLSMAKAVCMLAATKRGIPSFEYTPRKAKCSVVGYGGAEKIQVQKMVQILLHLPELPTPDDVADGLALAICHLNHLNFNLRIRNV